MDALALEALLRENVVPAGPQSGWKNELPGRIRGEIKWNEPLKRYTSMQVGGPAEALVFPADLADLQALVIFAKEQRVPYTVLGLGSNVLVRDGGIRGIVLRLNKTFNHMEILEETEDKLRLEAEAGYPVPRLVELGKEKGLLGVEPLYGIPGSVGGAVMMNAGTREGTVQGILESIQVVNPEGGLQNFAVSRLKFEYRHLKLPVRGIVVSARFCFMKGPREEVQSKIAAFQERRRQTQPLEFPSLGSVFKNPEKAYAAQWIEELGLKGVRVGGARISEKHANFIVNERGATARDVLALIGLIRDKVREEREFKLELEAKVIGEDESL